MPTLFDSIHTHKRCKSCGNQKPLTEFYPNGKYFFARCKGCLRTASRDKSLLRREIKCNKCNLMKPAAEFPKYGKICAMCRAASAEVEKIRQRKRSLNYYYAHKDICYLRNKEQYDKNRVRYGEVRRLWKEKNAEQEKASDRAWRQRNKERINAWTRNRVAKIRNAEGSHTAEEWAIVKEIFGHCCLKCGNPEDRSDPMKKLEADHVNPVNLGGSNWIANIQPLCRRCNISKNDQHIDYRPANWPELYEKALSHLKSASPLLA